MKNRALMSLIKTCGGLLALDHARMWDYISLESSKDHSEKLAAKRIPKVRGRIAILPVHGVLSQYGGWDSQSMDRLQLAVTACCNNPDIGAVVLNHDSPGGTAHGTMEAAARIREASEAKPVAAIANSLSASASYWLQSSAPFTAASPGSDVGSIGVYRMHLDLTGLLEKHGIGIEILRAGEHKIESNPFEPMNEEIRAREMIGVEECYREFTEAVAKYRGISVATVRTGFGKGLVYKAKKAAELGLVDRVIDLDGLLAKMSTKTSGKKSAHASDEELTTWLQDESGWPSTTRDVEVDTSEEDRLRMETELRERELLLT